MNRRFLIAVFLLLAAGPVQAAPSKTPGPPIPQLGPLPPSGPMPELGMGVLRDRGMLEIEYVITRAVRETRQRDTVVNELNALGVPVQRVRTTKEQVIHYVPERRLKQVGAGDYWVFQDGKLLDAKAAAKLLAHFTPILFARFEKPNEQFDPFYLQFFKPAAVIVGFAYPGP
jgi:hypothetical protein